MLLETPAPELGIPAPNFTLQDATGRTFTRDELVGPNGLLVAFICNHCPYVVSVADRLAADLKALDAAGVGTVLINSNDFIAYPDDAPEKMPAFAETFDLSSPYLVDESQDAARAYGAVCTPDFFGFGPDLTLQYRGRLDDVGRSSANNRSAELRDAMLAVASGGAAPTHQIPSMGCSLKWR